MPIVHRLVLSARYVGLLHLWPGGPARVDVALAQPVARVPAAPSSSQPLPIVFMHYGDSAYLRYTLHQAKHSNPLSTVYLLGDSRNQAYDVVEHHPFRSYFQDAAAFARVYEHHNVTSYNYALFDFQRWFVLREFLLSHGLSRCLYLDSDVMLYTDATEAAKRFERFDFALAQERCGCTLFVNSVSALSELLGFMMRVYTKADRYHYDRAVSSYLVRSSNGLRGGACDMTMLEFYREAHFGEVGEVSHIVDGATFDPNINISAPGVEMKDGVKAVTWKHGVPYGRTTRGGEEVRFNSLHFQGKAKRLIAQHYVGPALEGRAS